MSQDFRLKLSKNYEKKKQKQLVDVQLGQKMKNSATYNIPLEDHTLGDLLRIYLLKNKDVKFAGYRVPHPLEDLLEVKVQTLHEGIEPNKIVKSTLQALQKQLFDMESNFQQIARDKQQQYH